jgi:hypothetical protein
MVLGSLLLQDVQLMLVGVVGGTTGEGAMFLVTIEHWLKPKFVIKWIMAFLFFDGFQQKYAFIQL